MEQAHPNREDFFRNRVAKTFFLPFINGSWQQPMYPPRYLEEGDVQYEEGQHVGNGYEQFVADVWVGVVLTLMVLSCLCCMCTCLLYQRFQEWKRKVFGRHPGSPDNNSIGRNSNVGTDVESLPSYTIVSGLPSYEEALEQLKQIRDLRGGSFSKTSAQDAQDSSPSPVIPSTEGNSPPPLFSPLSVDLLQPTKN